MRRPGGPQTTRTQTPTRDPAVGAAGTPAVTDPALSPLANFTIRVDSRFLGPGAGEGINGYDSRRHRYDPKFINPTRFEIMLDATIGLRLHQNPPAATARSTARRRVPTTIADIERAIAAPETGGADAGVGGSGSPLIPKNVIAFQWVIEEVGGQFTNSKLVQRPVSPMQLAVFEVPHPGRYRVRLRVVLDDGRQAENKVEFSFRDWFIVSIGDSSASGQGNPELDGSVGLGGGTVCNNVTLAKLTGVKPRMANKAIWTEKLAWRSMRSGPALAARSLQYIFGQTRSSGGVRPRLDFDKIVFASFARSGAEILTGLIAPQGGTGDFIGVGQIEECRRTANGRRIDALMISIGGNDLGFAGVLADLVKKDSVFRKQLVFIGPGDDAAARKAIEKTLDKMLGVGLPPGQIGDLEVRFNTLSREIDALRNAPGLGEVYIAGYPTSLFEVKKGDKIEFRACGVFTGPDIDISPPDGASLKSRGLLLNALIKRKAAEFGWHFVDVEADFAGKGYCASDARTYWVRAEESCTRQGDFEGMMHPNHKGHAAYALRLSQALWKHTLHAAS